jgi:hypothetical protein
MLKLFSIRVTKLPVGQSELWSPTTIYDINFSSGMVYANYSSNENNLSNRWVKVIYRIDLGYN